MSGHLLSDELRKRLRINICDKLLFGNGTPPAADDLWNALSGRMSPSTEFCTAIRSISTMNLNQLIYLFILCK